MSDDFIVEVVDEFALKAQKLLPEHPSLFSGLSGLSLLYANLFVITRDEFHSKKSIEVLERAIKFLSDGKGGLTFANGVAGVGWLIKHLIKKEILSPLDAESLVDFDELLLENLKSDEYKNNRYYDLLFGLIGKGIYFLEGSNINDYRALEIIFARLNNLDVASNPEGLWYAMLGKEQRNEQNDYFDYGLAHGLPSISIFLTKLYKAGICEVECKHFVQTISDFLQKQRLKNRVSQFPSHSKSSAESRLAWCYGDLGIAFSLLQASIVLGKPSLKEDARRLAVSCTSRTLNNSFIKTEGDLIENGFCHGTLGLVHLFNQLYRKIGDDQLVEARDYWLSVTFGKNKKNIVANEYDAEKGVWMESGTLLNGYCGMGLVLLNLMDEQCDGLANITLTEL